MCARSKGNKRRTGKFDVLATSRDFTFSKIIENPAFNFLGSYNSSRVELSEVGTMFMTDKTRLIYQSRNDDSIDSSILSSAQKGFELSSLPPRPMKKGNEEAKTPYTLSTKETFTR